MEKITPFLWFDHQAEEAAGFYVSIFENSGIGNILRNGDAAIVVPFSLDGQPFSALNGGPRFQFNPSVSFFARCETEPETDTLWQKLAEGGTALMALDRYPWSERYGFVKDRYGLCWQVMLDRRFRRGGRRFVPSLLFTGPQRGQAEAAVRFYTGLFEGSSITSMSRAGAGEQAPEGMLNFAEFNLCGLPFTAMDHPLDQQPFAFNEALSFVVHCDTQAEVDFFWEKLTADGGEESMCGWLKDKFGLSWQIIPEALSRLLADPDPAKAQRATQAMLQMRKIEIEKLSAVL